MIDDQILSPIDTADLAMITAGLGDYVFRRTAAASDVLRTEDASKLADEQYMKVIADSLAVPLHGASAATETALAEHDEYRRDSTADRPLDTVTELPTAANGVHRTDVVAEASIPDGVGLIAALWPGQVFEISSRLNLARILGHGLGLTQPNGSPDHCEIPRALRAPVCVRRVQSRSISVAVTFALAYERSKRMIIAWRCCADCRDLALARNRDHHNAAAHNPLNAHYVEAE